VRLSRRRGACQTLAMKTPDGPSVAIVGVSGAVGQEFLRVSARATLVEAVSGQRRTGSVADPTHCTGVAKVSVTSSGA